MQMLSGDIQDLINTAAHDLKSPLRRIISYCDMLREDAAPRLTESETSMLGRIETNTLRMQTLVENLTLIIRLECLPTAFEVTDLNALLKDTCEAIPKLENETRKLSIPPLPPIQGSEYELEILFTHLLKNAQNYRKPEHPLNIDITATQNDDNLSITITDNGLGITKEFQADIMDPFKRLHTQDDIEGSGLGLAICNQIAKRHNGNLSFTSTENTGSAFTLTLPLKQG